MLVDISWIVQQITDRLENISLGCVHSDIIETDADTMSAKLEAEFVSAYFPKGDCEYWLLTTIIEKVVESVSDENSVSVGVYVNDVGIRNTEDGVHVYIQFEITVNDIRDQCRDVMNREHNILMAISKLDFVDGVAVEKFDVSNLHNGETHDTLEITLTDEFRSEYVNEIVDLIKEIMPTIHAELDHRCITYPVNINNLKIFYLDLFIKWR